MTGSRGADSLRHVYGEQPAQDRLSAEVSVTPRSATPVECLGLTFNNDEARRAHFLGRLRVALEELHARLAGVQWSGVEDAAERLAGIREWPMGNDATLSELAERMRSADQSKDLLQRWKDEVGFPHGEVDDILSLSDPPWHTACPNPFLAEFVAYRQQIRPASRAPYGRKPLTADIREGKNNPIYNTHAYHTKLPHTAILQYLSHYTDPGDIVLDGFSGSGMTGVAAVKHRAPLSGRQSSPANAPAQLSTILCDLSPLATFLSSNLLRPFAEDAYLEGVTTVLEKVQQRLGFLYTTRHTGWLVRQRKHVAHKAYSHNDTRLATVNFTLYSDVIRCPNCGASATLYSVAVDEEKDKLRSTYPCSECGSIGPKRDWEPELTTLYDPVLEKPHRQQRIVPVLINYTVGTTRYEKLPDDHDTALHEEALRLLEQHALPRVRLIEGKEIRRNEGAGITHIHHFFTAREHLAVAHLLSAIRQHPDPSVRNAMLFTLTAAIPYVSRLRRFRADRKRGGPLSGTLYRGALVTPRHPLTAFRDKALSITEALTPPLNRDRSTIVSAQDTGRLDLLSGNTIDYVFVDPPFADNLAYSELNFLLEGLLGVATNPRGEVVVSASQDKGVNEYRALMERSFGEFFRVLKPGRWITVVFASTSSTVWSVTQTALERSGFVVANVSTLDKKQHTFKAVTTSTALKQDLIISAYKPNDGLEGRFKLSRGKTEGVWDFLRTHLKQLPAFVAKDGQTEVVHERQPHVLYDRMVAFHVLRRATVPLSAGEFLAGLSQRFPERDGMVFLPDQVTEYDRQRMATGSATQLEILVRDEASTIHWLRAQLCKKPQRFQDLHPLFLRELRGPLKHEKLPELSEMLAQNFLHYDGLGDVPNQIHSYLSTNYKHLRNLSKDHPGLQAKARGCWYVPDPKKAVDVEKRRTAALLREFDGYRSVSLRRLRHFRLEAIRAGFFQAYREQDYATIILVAEKLPPTVLHEDQSLLLWYDQAVTRTDAS